ncbi:MAG: efflux RND transporter periplasmic adaptor subunit [Hymenobacter sp.]
MGGYVQTVDVLPGEHVRAGETVATLRSPEYLTLRQNCLQSKAKVRFLAEDLGAGAFSTWRTWVPAQAATGPRRLRHRAGCPARHRHGNAAARHFGGAPRCCPGPDCEPRASSLPPLPASCNAASINPGRYVGPQDILVEVLNRDDLHLELKVFEKDVAQVHPGQKILFKSREAGRPDEVLTARVFLVGQAFDDDARTVRVHAHLEPERTDLLPGQFIAARIQTRRRAGAHPARSRAHSGR